MAKDYGDANKQLYRRYPLHACHQFKIENVNNQTLDEGIHLQFNYQK